MSEVNEETLRAREALAGHYKEVLGLLGEDAGREGLLKTPERVAKAMQFLTKGYHEDPEAVLRSAMFQEEDYKQMVICILPVLLRILPRSLTDHPVPVSFGFPPAVPLLRQKHLHRSLLRLSVPQYAVY